MSPPTNPTGFSAISFVPLNLIAPPGLSPRKPNAFGAAVVNTLRSGFTALKLPSSPNLRLSLVLNVNAPSTSTFALLPNRKPFGFNRYRFASVISDLIRPSISETLAPVTLPSMF